MKRIALATTALFLLTGTAAFAEDVTCKPCDSFTYVNVAATDEPKAEKVAFNYKAFSRDPKKFTGKEVTITGKVVQVVEDEDDLNIRISTSGSYGDVVYVTYTRKSSDESRILADDRVTITGTYEGVHSYQSVMAGTITIPHIDADKIEQAPAVAKRSRR